MSQQAECTSAPISNNEALEGDMGFHLLRPRQESSEATLQTRA
ncbi:hypothetical protein [Sagittula sp. SSi028]